MDIPDPVPPLIFIVHLFRQVLKFTSRIGRDLLYVGSSWSSCLCSSMWRGPQEYVTYEFVPTSPAVSCMSGSLNMDCFCDGWYVAVQLLLCGVLPPGLVPNCLQQFCIVAVKLFSKIIFCPVCWGCRIHRLHLCRGVRPPPTSVLDKTLDMTLELRTSWTELLEIELFGRLKCVLMLNWIIWKKIIWHLTLSIAQSAGAVEYTDCPSAEG